MPNNLKRAALSGVIWSLTQAWGVRVITLGHFILIARLLEPNDLGIIAFATAIVASFSTVVDLGMGPQLESKADADDDTLNTAWWSAVISGLLLTLIIASSGLVLSTWTGREYLVNLMPVMALAVFFSAFSCVQLMVLKARFLHKNIAATALTSTLVGAAVGLCMAWSGWAYWALVAKSLVEAILTTVLLVIVCPWRPNGPWRSKKFMAMLKQGWPILCMRWLDIVNQRLDTILIGTRLGSTALGFYSTAQRIYQIAMEALFSAVNQVSLPVFGRVSHEPANAGVLLLRIVRITSLITVPAFGVGAVLATPIISLVFGERWIEAGPIFCAFCIGGMLFSVSYFNAPMMIACGGSRDVLRLSLLNAVTNAIVFFVAVPYGATAVAVAFVVRGYLVYPLNLYYLKRISNVSMIDYISGLLPATVATLLAMLLIHYLMPEISDISLWFQIIVSVISAVTVYIIVLRFLFKSAWRSAIFEMQQLRVRDDSVKPDFI